MEGHLRTDIQVSERSQQRWLEQPVDTLLGHRKRMTGSLAATYNETTCRDHRVPPLPIPGARIPRHPEVHDRVRQQISTSVQARQPLTHDRLRTTEDVTRDRGGRGCK